MNKIPQIGEYWQFDDTVYIIKDIDTRGHATIDWFDGSTTNYYYNALTVYQMADHVHWKQHFLTPQIINDYAIF